MRNARSATICGALRDKYHLDDSTAGIVGREDIEDVVSRWTGVPITSIKEEETQKLLRVEEELHKRVISQDKSISALARAIRRSRAGLKSPNRPIGSFLFLGPTGVGKTEMARTLAQFLFGSEKSLIRFDMSEFMEKHSVSKLIGSPPGYVGYEEGGQLTERVKRSPYSVVLLDEIEKAHADVFNILLQVFEDGQLTDGLGNTVDFKNTIIIMTSNIGARHLQRKQGLGFQSDREDLVMEKIEDLVKNEVKRTFNPEFLNRIDEIILFQSLTDADLIQILELLVQQLNANLAQKAITISVTEEAKKWILEKTLVDRSYGARPLRRALQRYVEDPLSEALIAGGISERPAFLEVYLDQQPALLSPGGQRRRGEDGRGSAGELRGTGYGLAVRVAKGCGAIRSPFFCRADKTCEDRGAPCGSVDMLIAAVAAGRNFTVLTCDQALIRCLDVLGIRHS